jgi:CheY-like chemotaxis protein
VQKVILVVDDSPTNLALAAFVLEEAGFKVVKAVNGREGIDLARSTLPDLVLCDIHMPIADGIQVARTFAADPALSRIPLVALTATTDPAELPAILANGFAGYLEKPLVLGNFVQQVRAYFGTPA